MLKPSDLFLFTNAMNAKLKLKETASILESRIDFVNWDYQMSKLDPFLSDKSDCIIIDKMLLNIYVCITNDRKAIFNPADYRIASDDSRQWGNAFHDVENLLKSLIQKQPATAVAN